MWCFLRSESLVFVIVMHAFCNWFGLPDFGYLLFGTEGITKWTHR